MKKALLIILSLLLAFLIAIAVEWDPVMDLLPFDRSGWKVKDEVHYYLDESGDPLTGWQEIDGNRYYFDEDDGVMYTGLVAIDLEFYCMDENGVMQTGWIDGRYFHEDGRMATGWLEDGDVRYYLSENGSTLSGWQEFGGLRYWFAADGSTRSGWFDLEGQRYYLNDDGSVYFGWLELDGSRYYLNEDGVLATGWLQTEEGLFYLNEDGTAASGWVELEGTLFYIGENGRCAEGWNEIDGKRYYMNSDGSCRTGWQDIDGQKYYFKEDGSAATGRLIIDEITYYFTSTGANIILVNPWNEVPEDYEVELVTLSDGHKIAADMQPALERMLADCEAAGHKPFLKSAYRTYAQQVVLFNNKVNEHNGDKVKAATIVAVPGTSEHHLGYAVDITDYNYQTLNYDQEKTGTQKWLLEHCWEYGFILRYPNEKSEITGIIYEPWHYRYVGVELAMELKDSGLCLEEYLENLTTA